MYIAFLSTGLERNLWILFGWDKSTQYLLRSCALTLNKCALDAGNYETIVEG
jgi:hypothetical protein